MADRPQYVTVVNPTDVLFGRGSGPNDHEGNIRFRDVVARRKAEYMSTNHRQTKAIIAKDVVNTVYQSQGRFLKKLEAKELQNLGLQPTAEVYQIIDDQTVMEKAKQALRQNREKTSDRPRSISPKRKQTAAVSSFVSKPNIAVPNYGRDFVAHEASEPWPIPEGSTQGVAEHVKPQENPSFSKYAQQLEDIAASQGIANTSGDMMRRIPRRHGSSNSRQRDSLAGSLRLSQLIDQDGDGISAMMESFKGMSTTGEFMSEESIGTIENMFGEQEHQVSGMSNMSMGNMSISSNVFNDKSERSSRPRMSMTSTRSTVESLRDTGDWVFDEPSPSGISGGGGGNLWPLEESRNSSRKKGGMLPPPNRSVGMTAEQISTSLMAEPLQDSQSNGTFDLSGSMMMNSIDSLSFAPHEEKK